MMGDRRRGLTAAIAACTIWGLSSPYYALLSHVPPLEVLAHRTFWSLVFFAGVLAIQRRLSLLPRLIANRDTGPRVLAAALFISSNWFCFIYSIQIGRAIEASLGYYIMPLTVVALAVLLFGERLSRAQGLAVALAALSVLGFALALGAAPWISLLIAGTFAIYGVIKRGLVANPVVTVTGEVALLAPVALGFLVWLWTQSALTATAPRDLALLMVSGPLTATPLILFTSAARRLDFATLGIAQYLNPTLQAVAATLVLGEAFTPAHAGAFGGIWLALALYSADAVGRARASRRTAMASGTSAASDTNLSSEASAKPSAMTRSTSATSGSQ